MVVSTSIGGKYQIFGLFAVCFSSLFHFPRTIRVTGSSLGWRRYCTVGWPGLAGFLQARSAGLGGPCRLARVVARCSRHASY